jgi:hypothetical protein
LQWVFAQSQRAQLAAGSAPLLLHFPFFGSAHPPSPSSIHPCPDATRTLHGSHAGDAHSQMDHWVGLAAWVGCGRYRSRSTLRGSGWVRAHRSWSRLAQLYAALALTASPPVRKARAVLSRAFLAHGSPSSTPSIERDSNENYGSGARRAGVQACRQARLRYRRWQQRREEMWTPKRNKITMACFD